MSLHLFLRVESKARAHFERKGQLFGAMVRRIEALPVPAGWEAAAAQQTDRRQDGTSSGV